MKKTLEYEETPVQDISKRALRKQIKIEKEKPLRNLSSSYLIWYMFKRHKVGLLAFSNVITLTALIVVTW